MGPIETTAHNLTLNVREAAHESEPDSEGLSAVVQILPDTNGVHSRHLATSEHVR